LVDFQDIIRLLGVVGVGVGSECPVGKITKKNSLNECVFVNSALKLQCPIVKSTLLQTAF